MSGYANCNHHLPLGVSFLAADTMLRLSNSRIVGEIHLMCELFHRRLARLARGNGGKGGNSAALNQWGMLRLRCALYLTLFMFASDLMEEYGGQSLER